MGNCQAIEAAALVIQHPCGKIERLYWSISASEVMRLNPGHYVSLIIPILPLNNNDNDNDNGQPKTVRFTRVKLLRPSETLSLGHAYRLVTTQEVMKVLKAKKYAKAKKQQVNSDDVEIDHHHRHHNHHYHHNDDDDHHQSSSDHSENNTQHKAAKSEGHRQRASTPTSNAGVTRSKSWRPSLQSISEAAL